MPDSSPLEPELPFGESGEAETPAAPPEAPSYVAQQDFAAFRDSITGNFSALQGTIESLRDTIGMIASQARQPAPAPTAHLVTDEEVEQAQATGDFKTLKRYLDQREAALVERTIAPLQKNGIEAIAATNGEIAASKLPHFRRFEKEIRQFVSTMPPETRIHPQSWTAAYNFVVGQNVDALVEERAAEKMRAAAQPSPEPMPTQGRAGRVNASTQAPTVMDYAGGDGVAALQSAGLDEQAFVKKLGYRDWDDYMNEAYGRGSTLSKRRSA